MQQDPNTTEATTLAPGTIVGQYEVIRLIGKGGRGCVYEAKQLHFDRPVALKVLSTELLGDEISRKRFQIEAQSIASLVHPNIIKIYSTGVSDKGVPYIAMELLNGEMLSTKLQRSGCLEIQEFGSFSSQILDALEHAHNAAVVHRDIKPSNITILSDVPESENIKLLDFGLAKILQPEGGALQNLTQTGNIVGTPAYISPEQIKSGAADPRSDIYSLAVVFYECLAGKVPFVADNSMQVLYLHMNEPVPPMTKGLEHLDRVIRKCLSKNPDERYQNVSSLRADLAAAINASKNIAVDGVAKRKVGKLQLALITAFVAIGACAAWIFWSPSRTSGSATKEADKMSAPPERDNRSALKNRNIISLMTAAQNDRKFDKAGRDRLRHLERAITEYDAAIENLQSKPVKYLLHCAYLGKARCLNEKLSYLYAQGGSKETDKTKIRDAVNDYNRQILDCLNMSEKYTLPESSERMIVSRDLAIFLINPFNPMHDFTRGEQCLLTIVKLKEGLAEYSPEAAKYIQNEALIYDSETRLLDRTYYNLADLYWQRGDLKKAESYFNKFYGRIRFGESNSHREWTYRLFRYVVFLSEIGQKKASSEVMDQTKKLADFLKEPRDQATFNLQLAQTYHLLHDNKSALECLDRAWSDLKGDRRYLPEIEQYNDLRTEILTGKKSNRIITVR